MELTIKNPAIKKLSFEEFEKTFHPGLAPAASNAVIFYRILDDAVEISFSYDNFIIITGMKIESIKEKYPANENDYAVVMEEKPINPSIKKFVDYATWQRGIQEL